MPLIQEEQVVSYWRKNGHLILINCLWELAREECGSVTDGLNMTLVVYRGRKALNQSINHSIYSFLIRQ